VTSPAVRAVGRRYHLLLALRFVPTGLVATVLVLLLQERGLSLAQIGVGTAAQGMVMLVLELPSGGLADALGRKPVVMLATGFGLLSSGLLLLVDSVMLLAVVFTLQGIFRALDSGPLQAWYIDTLLAADRGVDMERVLGRADVVICSAVGVGALLGGLIVAQDGLLGATPLVWPVVVALAVQAAGLVAVALLVDEHRRVRGRGWRAARHAALAVPGLVRDAMGVVHRSSVLTALVVAELLWGFGIVAFETFMPPRLAEIGGGADQAAVTLGPALTAAWVLSAVGSGVAPRLVRRFGPARTGLGLRLSHGLTVVAMGVAAGPTGLVAAYLCTYWVHGATNTVHYAMVHRAVDSRHRATVVSANSLTSQVGGAVSGIALGALADAAGIATAMFVAAGVLASAGPLYLAGGRSAVSAVPGAVEAVGPPR
jgi:MFS family permease